MLLILAVALLVRLAVVVLYAHEPGGTPDPAFYWNAGANIAEGNGYRSPAGDLTAYFPPGYPYFLGGLMAAIEAIGLANVGASAIGAAQALLGTATVLLVILTGRLLGGSAVGLAAGAIVALWPNLIAYSAAFLSETLFVALFALFLYATARMVIATQAGWRWTLLAAGTLGAATLVRPQVLVAVPALVLAWLIAGIGWRRTVLWALALTAGTVVVVAPWAARNATVFGAVVPVSTNGGVNLCIGFSSQAWGGFHLSPDCVIAESYSQGSESELANDRILSAAALDWIARNPEEIPLLSIRKLRYTYWPDNDGLQGIESYGASPIISTQIRPALELTGNVFYAFIALLAVAGFAVTTVRCTRDRTGQKVGWLILALTLSGALIPVLVFGDPRFKVPVTPLLAILAGVALVTGARRLRADRGEATETVEAPRRTVAS